MELTADQLEVWIRENFFAEFSDSEFAKHIAKAKDAYLKTRVYFEDHGLSLSVESLNAVKDLILSGEAPPDEVKAAHAQDTGGAASSEVSATVVEPATLDTIDERIRTIEKRALWALIALFIIILIK